MNSTNTNNLGSGYGSTLPLNTYQTGACAAANPLSTPTKCTGNNTAATMFCNANRTQVPFSPPSNMKLFYEPPKNC